MREDNRHDSPYVYALGMFSRKHHGQERVVLGFQDLQGPEPLSSASRAVCGTSPRPV